MNKKKFISIILIILWMGVIYYFSDMDREESGTKSVGIVKNVITEVDKITNASIDTVKRHQSDDFLDKANYYFRRSSHAFVYFVLSILVLNLLVQIMKNKIYILNIISVIFCFLYACTDEFHQTFVMGRTGQFMDTFVDVLGAIIGCLVFDLIYMMIKRKKAKCVK